MQIEIWSGITRKYKRNYTSRCTLWDSPTPKPYVLMLHPLAQDSLCHSSRA